MKLSRRGFLRALAAVPSMLAGCGSASTLPKDDQLQTSFFCFDTVCAVGGTMSQELLDELVASCQGFERTLSRTIATSDVGRINAAGGRPVEVEPQTAELIARALEYSRSSDGLFDITIGAVSELWDFHEGIVPTPEQLAQALPHVGYELVHVDGTTVTLDDPDARIDLGGIAKGYVADVLVAQMREVDVPSGYVNLGGNVKVLGAKSDGSPWQVGVRDPAAADDGGSSVARIALTDGSVVTSGLYERQFEQDGHRYWHILDPRTGSPVESDLVSATIVSDASIDGDGYTKPLFMMGTEQALAWAMGHPELKVLLIDQSGTATMCPDDSFDLL